MVHGSASSQGTKSKILAVRKSSSGLYRRCGSHQRAKDAFPCANAGLAASKSPIPLYFPKRIPLWIPTRAEVPCEKAAVPDGMRVPSSLRHRSVPS
eukprot:16430938-Heterocapsa_arctica.AAC.1